MPRPPPWPPPLALMKCPEEPLVIQPPRGAPPLHFLLFWLRTRQVVSSWPLGGVAGGRWALRQEAEGGRKGSIISHIIQLFTGRCHQFMPPPVLLHNILIVDVALHTHTHTHTHTAGRRIPFSNCEMIESFLPYFRPCFSLLLGINRYSRLCCCCCCCCCCSYCCCGCCNHFVGAGAMNK